jgi:3-(3-hydroxy-phenyl)propionate hydroxylase
LATQLVRTYSHLNEARAGLSRKDGKAVQHMKQDKDRVLVVGAGPVGLVTAVQLARRGVPVQIIEASPDLPEDLRASTFHPPTLDMLDEIGVAASCVAQGLICPHWQFRDRQKGVIAAFDLSLLAGETAHPYRLQCEQWKLTRLLRDKLVEAGVAITYGLRATDVRQDDAGVTLLAEDADGAVQEFPARYLVGADGARGVVRKAMDVAFDGMTIPEIYFSVSTTHEFTKDFPDLTEIAYISDPDEWFVLLRTPSLWRVLLPTDGSESDEQITDPARVEQRLQSVAASSVPYTVVHRTAYRVHERVAEHYVAGRVFLAGDAAHLNNPLGGMGMNGGIHDAVNLAEKLAAVWHGADPALMGRYERQRRKVAVETVQAQSMRNRKILNERDPAARAAYHDELRATVADPARHLAYVRRSSMIASLRELEDVA